MSPEHSSETRAPAEKALEAGTWGVFFVWIGVALLAALDWGIWLLGVGAIILGAQLARRLMSLRTEVFWIVAGILFVAGGLSEVSAFELDIALIPLLCILAGIGLLMKALSHRARAHQA